MYPESTELEGILMLRIDAPLFFANVESVKYAIRKNENKYIQRGRQFEFVILDLSPVTDIDASAVHFLKVRAFCVSCLQSQFHISFPGQGCR